MSHTLLIVMMLTSAMGNGDSTTREDMDNSSRIAEKKSETSVAAVERSVEELQSNNMILRQRVLNLQLQNEKLRTQIEAASAKAATEEDAKVGDGSSKGILTGSEVALTDMADMTKVQTNGSKLHAEFADPFSRFCAVAEHYPAYETEEMAVKATAEGMMGDMPATGDGDTWAAWTQGKEAQADGSYEVGSLMVYIKQGAFIYSPASMNWYKFCLVSEKKGDCAKKPWRANDGAYVVAIAYKLFRILCTAKDGAMHCNAAEEPYGPTFTEHCHDLDHAYARSRAGFKYGALVENVVNSAEMMDLSPRSECCSCKPMPHCCRKECLEGIGVKLFCEVAYQYDAKGDGKGGRVPDVKGGTNTWPSFAEPFRCGGRFKAVSASWPGLSSYVWGLSPDRIWWESGAVDPAAALLMALKPSVQ